jgi:hypothetical protein
LEHVLGFARHSIGEAADMLDQLIGFLQEADRVGTVAHGLELETPFLGDGIGGAEAVEGSPGRIVDTLDA